jgi:hypothetical protein
MQYLLSVPQFGILVGLLFILACVGTYLIAAAAFNWRALRLSPGAKVSSRVASFGFGYLCWALPMTPLAGLSERYVIARVILWSYMAGLVAMIGFCILINLRRMQKLPSSTIESRKFRIG